ncbi:gamma-glutamyltranspeptidase [Cylindrobasidium torrendii FP15055 ss-10]|uniref:Glutathione hydrolase n=1 Tax=Cylindrobasidium torrendii FP15055 ss-10 TaxID=1314674 RepID=A0A0D7AVU2_9AGAR|nr:gamma-glutamyltranspeptidase [Cylindrobasidium torrendii FP15055 ss-10]
MGNLARDEKRLPDPITATQPVSRIPWRRRIVLGAFGALVYLLVSTCWTLNHQAVHRTARNPSYLIVAEHGAVATENKRCSDIGVDVLKDGGNAVDAAISANLCVGVVNMFSAGIGGGGFMTVRIPPESATEGSRVYNVDFRETAPAAAHPHMYPAGSNSSRFGGLSVGVPGELRGMEAAHDRWGSLPWKRLVQPVADLAAGWTVDAELGRRLPWFPFLITDPDWKPLFAANGTYLGIGEPISRPSYSRTLSTIAEEGADAFYKGPIADAIIRKVQEKGGILTHADLESYSVKVTDALEGSYHGQKIYTTHAPTSGPALLHMLNLVEKYDFSEMSALNIHRMVEAIKFGFASRTRICDPAYQNNTDAINEMSTKAFADLISANITDDTTHPPSYYNPEFDVKIDHGTNHVSVVDQTGMAVSLTSTVNLLFGSQVLDPETGIIFNDEMDDFSVPGTPNGFGLWPSPYNYPEAGKRPLSSTVPTIIENIDGSLYAVLGGSGGSLIFPAVFQTFLHLGWGMDISQAIEFGRVHDQLYPQTVIADDIYPSDLLEGLKTRGHNVTVLDVNRVAAVIQGVVIGEDNQIYAASDSRKNGIAAGY